MTRSSVMVNACEVPSWKGGWSGMEVEVKQSEDGYEMVRWDGHWKMRLSYKSCKDKGSASLLLKKKKKQHIPNIEDSACPREDASK